jgi:hypothetical protein
LIVRTGSASASAIAGSFQPFCSSASMPRQMSKLFIEARIRFSERDSIGPLTSSPSATITSMVARPAAIAAVTRRVPALITSSPSL